MKKGLRKGTVHPRKAEQRQEHVENGDDEEVPVEGRTLLQTEITQVQSVHTGKVLMITEYLLLVLLVVDGLGD